MSTEKTSVAPTPLVTATAPEKIYIDLGFDPRDSGEIHFSYLRELTWSADNATGMGIEYVRADLATQPAPQGLPDGWKLVPIKPTPEMMTAAFDAYTARLDGAAAKIINAHKAMLAAAPAAPQAEPQQPVDAVDSDVRKALHRILILQGLHRDSPTYQRAIAAGRELLGLPADSSAQQPAGEYPPLPQGDVARFRCDSCEGRGEIGDPISQGYFQPPERETCTHCKGSGCADESMAFSESDMRDYADATVALRKHEIIGDFLTRTGQYVTNDASREAVIAEAVAADRAARAAPTTGGQS